MRLRFYVNPLTGEPEIWKHQVEEDEVYDVLELEPKDFASREGTRSTVGQTRGGRWIRVIYVKDPQPNSYFVITAYALRPKTIRALRRRLRRKK